MPPITPSAPPERGPSAGGERFDGRGTLRLRGKSHRRADGGNVDNQLEGHGAPRSQDMELDHGSINRGDKR